MKFPRRLEDGTIVTTEDTKGMSIQEIIKEYSEFPCSEVKRCYTPFNTSVSRDMPAFTMTVFGKIMTFAIDTGCSTNMVIPSIVELWPKECKGRGDNAEQGEPCDEHPGRRHGRRVRKDGGS